VPHATHLRDGPADRRSTASTGGVQGREKYQLKNGYLMDNNGP
jgi:hypothetical protein